MSQTKAQLVAPVGVVTATGMNVSGVLTATTFDGSFTGAATSIAQGKNLNVGVVTASGIAGDITGSATSITQGTNVTFGSLTATFVGDFTGTASSIMPGSNITAGVVTASSFSGPVTGNVTGNLTGNVTGTAGSIASGNNLWVGVATATMVGDGSNLTGVAASSFTHQTVTADGATTSIDLSAGNIITFNQSSNTTVSLANTTSGAMSVTLIRTTDATSTARTITWPSSILWTGGVTPTLVLDGTGEESQIFRFLTRDSGVTWFGWEAQQHRPEKHALWTWGSNGSGQFGVNYINQGPESISAVSPRVVGSLTDSRTWQRVSYEGSTPSSSNCSVLATKTDGTLWAWGLNNYGQLGVTGKQSKSSPVQVGTETTWAWAEMGGNPGAFSSVAVKTDGTLWCWGENKNGQLGQNNKTDKQSPVQVGTDTDWETALPSSTRCSGEYCIVQKTDGSLWSWGNNESGCLGLNQNDSHRSSPAQIPGNWDYFSVGHESNVAIKSGKLYGWGNNSWGLLGHNDGTPRSSPKQVGSDSNWSKVHISGRGCIATKTDGSLWTWGTNRYGALGQNESGPSSSPYGSISSPTQIPGTWTNIHRSGSSSTLNTSSGYIAVKDDKLWMWGQTTMAFNDVGPYGMMSSPTQILGITSTSIYDAGTAPGPYGGYFIGKANI